MELSILGFLSCFPCKDPLCCCFCKNTWKSISLNLPHEGLLRVEMANEGSWKVVEKSGLNICHLFERGMLPKFLNVSLLPAVVTLSACKTNKSESKLFISPLCLVNQNLPRLPSKGRET